MSGRKMYSHCSPMDRPTLADDPKNVGHGTPFISSKPIKVYFKDFQQVIYPRALEKPKVGNVSMEIGWYERLRSQKGWSHRACLQSTKSIASTTMKTYSCYVNKLKGYCESVNVCFPPSTSGDIADFMCCIADSANSAGTIKVCYFAIKKYYSVNALDSCIFDKDLDDLISGLVKSSDLSPIKRSKAMPIEPFIKLICIWGDNSKLQLSTLRNKTLLLLALSLMLRPSDVAPHAKVYIPQSDTFRPQTFSTDYLTFNEDGSVNVTVFAVKNDVGRKGFNVLLPKHEDPLLDPVSCLKLYIEKSDMYRGDNRAVFLSTKSPYKTMDSSQISQVLNYIIAQAGLCRKTFSARFFRCTGATRAIEKGIHPDIVRVQGRWKTNSAFYDHYVHSRTPEAFTLAVLGQI